MRKRGFWLSCPPLPFRYIRLLENSGFHRADWSFYPLLYLLQQCVWLLHLRQNIAPSESVPVSQMAKDTPNPPPPQSRSSLFIQPYRCSLPIRTRNGLSPSGIQFPTPCSPEDAIGQGRTRARCSCPTSPRRFPTDTRHSRITH